MAFTVNVTFGCICRAGNVCAYHSRLTEIIEGCQLGGCSLAQRLATIEYSTIVDLQREAAIIRAELAAGSAAPTPAGN